MVKLGSVLTSVSRPVDVQADESYRQIGIRSHGKGVFQKESVSGTWINRRERKEPRGKDKTTKNSDIFSM